MDNKPDKSVPANLEAEEAVLGSLLIDPDAVIKIAAFLKADDFYREKNGWIYQVILDLHERREPADFVTLVDELERREQLSEVGGIAYVTALVNSVPTAVHVEYYARIVERTATLRRLIGAAGQIAALAYEEAEDVDEVVDRAEQLIFSVSERRVRRDLAPVRQIMGDVVNRIEYLHSHRGEVLGVPSGFARLDKLLGGFQKSDLVILAARPGVGKCIVSGSRLLDPTTGRLVTIDEIVRERSGHLLTLAGNRRFEVTRPSDFVDDGIKPVYRVRTTLGREILTTASHPYLTRAGWIPLGRLVAGDDIAVPAALPYFGNRVLPEAQIRLLAYLSAEGCLTDLWAQMDEDERRLRAEFAEAAAELQGDGAASRTVSLCRLGLAKPSPEKRIPTIVFELTRPLLALFLNRLFACDGSIRSSAGAPPQVTFTAGNTGLAHDVQHLLLRFGILAGLRAVSSGRGAPSYELCISRPGDVLCFLSEIGATPHGGRAWAASVPTRQAPGVALAAAPGSPCDPERTDDCGDICWDTIESIESVGPRQVYDLTVDVTHNFVAEDMLVHNTSLALNVGVNAAKRFGQRVAFFSLEMSSEQLVQRLLSAETGINQQRLRLGDINEEEWGLLMAAAGELSETLLFIDDTPAMSALELRTKARRLQAEHGLDMIIVDYLQLMRGEGRNENRVQEISYITRSLKGLARELEVPLIALSQLSRAVEQRTDHRPVLSDLRESGCVPADTRVLRADTGEEVTIGQLVLSQETPLVWSVDDRQRLVPARLVKTFPTGIKPVFRVHLASGRAVDATANHPFLTIEGWTRLDALQLGAFVATPRRLPVPVGVSSSRWSDDELVLLAHMLGDGTMGPSFKYATADAANKQAVVDAARRQFGIDADASRKQGNTWQIWFPSPHRLTHDHYHPMRIWLEPLGLFQSRAWTKFVPQSVFSLPDEKVALFLRHLWATDGSITLTTNGRGELVNTYYSTTSHQLALDVQRLLLRFGIISTIGKGKKERTNGAMYRPGYMVRIQGAGNQMTFLQSVGCYGQRGDCIPAALSILSQIKENPNNDLVPWAIAERVRVALSASRTTHRDLAARLGEGYCGSYLLGTPQRPRRFSRERLLKMGEITNSQALIDVATSDLYWDRVVDITLLGDQPTFDATIEGTHSFIANGIVVHNSIEQDADIVMFIYREDMVKEESEKKNVADVIVAKHRNGPTDTVPLFFDKALTRFADLEVTREPLEYGA